MYDLVTSSVLFFLLAPGVILTLPPGASAYVAALVHAAVFFVVQQYLSRYVPAWGIWVAGVLVLVVRWYMGRQAAASTGFLGTTPLYAGRRH